MNPVFRRRLLARGPKTSITKVAPAPIAVPVELVGQALEYAKASKAKNTRRAYASQWRRFELWCQERGASPLPAAPAVLALYITERAQQGARIPTIDQAVAAIVYRHVRAKLPRPSDAPEVEDILNGIRRTTGRAKKQATPLSPDLLRRMVRAAPVKRAGFRDNALALVGFAAALRRHELVDLDVSDAIFTEEGLQLLVRRSKTDQEGHGATISVKFGADPETCPVRALRLWLDESGIEQGAIFRGVHRSGRVSGKRLDGRDVSTILQRAARRAGIELANISGHSMRAGLGTTAAKQGKRLEVIQKHMRHKRLDQTLEYVRQAKAFDEEENAMAGIGL
jgi:integrase